MWNNPRHPTAQWVTQHFAKNAGVGTDRSSCGGGQSKAGQKHNKYIFNYFVQSIRVFLGQITLNMCFLTESCPGLSNKVQDCKGPNDKELPQGTMGLINGPRREP